MYDSKYTPRITFEEHPRRYDRRSQRHERPNFALSKRFWWKAVGAVGLLLLAGLFFWQHSPIFIQHAETAASQPSDADRAVIPDTATFAKPASFAQNPAIPPNVDWSQYACSQYVTQPEHICQAVMIYDALERVGSKAARVMMYPNTWTINDSNESGRLILKARDEYGVQLIPVEILRAGRGGWAEGFTKFACFNLTQYKRILQVDSDATLLKVCEDVAQVNIFTLS